MVEYELPDVEAPFNGVRPPTVIDDRFGLLVEKEFEDDGGAMLGSFF